MLLEYFTKGTEATITGANIGIEVETDFLTCRNTPIETETTKKLLLAEGGRPKWCQQRLELGRQKIELAISPANDTSQALIMTREALEWLYGVAVKHGAQPLFVPEIDYKHSELLYVQEERDSVWVDLDGKQALEHLCRCSSVQFTIDVNPVDAIELINKLWIANLHELDYAENNRRWKLYIAESLAGYRTNRYAGPQGFVDIEHYTVELAKNNVVMHAGMPCNQPITQVKKPNIDLFLRSVWWHYRLRRYGNTLTLEIRPFARRNDDDIETKLNRVLEVLDI